MDKDEMNEEELFCKLFPEYAVNGKPLSPYFDFFESGYEQAENRIEELEKENAELKDYNKKLLQSDIDKQNKIVLLSQKVNDLQKENAELKEQLRLAIEMPYSAVKKFAEEKTQEQLTNAKELLNMFLRLHYSPIVDEHTLFCKVEQFLNSEVEK